MYIKRVVIENIRGFESLDFEFDPPDSLGAAWSVITGDNASGKTSFLKSVAVALVGPSTARVLQEDFSSWIQKGHSTGRVAVQLVAGPDDRFATGKRFGQAFWSEIELFQEHGNPVSLRSGGKYVGGKRGGSRGPWMEHPSGWFCVGYGPFRRLYGHSPEAQRLMSTSGKVSRFATLFREDATLYEADGWLRELYFRKLEGNQESRVVLEKVLAVLNSGILRNDVTVSKVDSSGLWLMHVSGEELPLKDMSDGYRSTLALVVDILRHAIDVHGHEKVTSNAAGTVVDVNGVVLIDEIDAHLHPEWQRIIGEFLMRIFPSVQFIVATHSAFVCQSASKLGIYHLPSPQEPNPTPFRLDEMSYKKVIASRPNLILASPAFGLHQLRSPRAIRARLRYAQLAAKRDSQNLTSPEQNEYQQLEMFALSDNYETTT